MPILRRKPMISEYVRVDEKGNLDIRTPPDCTNWDAEFLLRLSRYWLAPGSTISYQKYVDQYVSTDWVSKLYKISGVRLRMYYDIEKIKVPRNSLRVRATIVGNPDTRIAIEVTHKEFIFRNLQVYELAKAVQIGGVPNAKRVDYEAIQQTLARSMF